MGVYNTFVHQWEIERYINVSSGVNPIFISNIISFTIFMVNKHW